MQHRVGYDDQPQYPGNDGPTSPGAGAEAAGGASIRQPSEDRTDQPHYCGNDGPEPPGGEISISDITVIRFSKGNSWHK
ncbi:hypothetical protein AAXB25_23285 [Paenibacillus lautus]|uniref:hypothetical protein n=1 Tax=Paenibacillus lautus TaxID=1401 RepID=UPI003D29DBF4